MTDDPRPVEGRCGYTIIDKDGLEQPCERPATGWRWYQDCDHEDTLDVACDRHENEGGRRLAAADRENAEQRGEVERLRELVAVGPWVVQAEAAEILGVSHQRISQLKAAGALPDPVAVLPGATIWRRADIEDFGAERADQRAALIEPPLPTVDEPVPTALGDPRLPARFWEKVVPSLGCWEWVGSRSSQGYGWFTEQPSHRAMLSHRIAYRAFRGSTDDGLHVDHLCRNPSCCNPDHLEVVTPSVNVLRGVAARAEGLPKQSAPRQWTEAEVDDLRSQLAAAQAQLAEAQTALTIIRVWANTKHGGVKTPAEVWPGLNAALSAAPQPEPDRRRDWMRPTAEMTELENVGGATLKRACIDLGLPTWGTKKKIAGHLLDVGMTAGLVRARWSWRALHDNPEPPASDEPARCEP